MSQWTRQVIDGNQARQPQREDIIYQFTEGNYFLDSFIKYFW